MSSDNVCNEKIYQSIFYDHSQAVLNFIWFKSGDKALAEDILQEAFVRLWKNCQSVPFAKAKSFLYTVASNLFIDSTRKQKHANTYVDSQDAMKHESVTPQAILEKNELKDRLQQAIKSLPAKQQEVFIMNRVDGHTYKEIAAILNISVKAVEKRMHNALVALRKVTFEK